MLGFADPALRYHHAIQAISELGGVGAPSAALMNYGGFLLYGLLIVALAVGLHNGIRRGPGDWLGPVLLAICGLAYVAVAFAPCNPGIATPLVLFPRLAKDTDWTRMSPLAVVMPVLGYLFFLLPLPGLTAGWQQRLLFACTLMWILALAWRLFNLARKASSVAPAAA